MSKIPVEVDVKATVFEISHALGKAASMSSGYFNQKFSVAEAVELVVQEVLSHPWVDDELKETLVMLLCKVFQAQPIHVSED